MPIARRSVLAGLGAGLLLPRAARAAPVAAADRLFGGTPLADNRLARTFARVDLALPDVPVLTRTGRQRFSQPAAGPRLMTLWAEWCVPCLLEARDLAAARPRVAGAGFDIVSVLTGSVGKLDYAGAVQRLDKAGAPGLTLLVEPEGGHAIADALSTRPPPLSPSVLAELHLPPGARIVRNGGGFALPCTLLVDRHNRVRGRASGMPPATPLPAGILPGHALTEAQKQAMMGDGTRTAWSTPDGLAFLRALHDGLLDRV